MSFDLILGQAPAVETLTRALRSGRVHHAYRFEGPDGVGKELTAFALAQALVCETPSAMGCGACSACRRAVTLADDEPRVPLHPDVVLVERRLYPQSILGASEAVFISVEQVRRVILARTGFPPHEGRALVFIVRAAEELSPSAANALLKTLEEPAPRTHFILLTNRPNRLLDTVRSRTLAVRFGGLSDEIIATLLERDGKPAEVARLAQGSASAAFDLADPERTTEREAFVNAALGAVSAPDLASALELLQERASERHEVYAQLGFVAQAFAELGRSLAANSPYEAERAAHRHQVVLRAMQDIEANVQPALALDAMVTRLRAV